ncbi:MAG: serine/threonine-protein kinase [Terrestrivirus sp.]|uniref:Serine/threonine-protein kinase n=1 Tax=Terrestrivirus sp. TaxID=2487775 RepID=A0A3G4ZNP1_9VIRU|nr:MAG: serine/threonine-protein kinase [Terrestrivirus sp.]
MLKIGKFIDTTYRYDNLYEGDCYGQKCMLLEKYYTNDKYHELLINNMRKYSHPNLVKFIGSQENYIVMEYAGIPLKKYMMEDPPEHSAIKSIVLQLTNILLFLEKEDEYHLFLKPDNIFIDPLTRNVKLFDFGIEYEDRHPKEWNIKKYNPYESERIGDNNSRKKEDVWIFGVILFQLELWENVTTKGFQYNSWDYVTKWVFYPRTPVVIERCQDKKLEYIIRKCLIWEEYRPSMKELKPLIIDCFGDDSSTIDLSRILEPE